MTAQPAKPKAPKLPQMIIPDDLEIEYVNLVRISHSPSELVLDFAHLLPGGKPPQVSSRIVMTPVAAKLFVLALGENLKKFEATHGEIKVPGNKSLADYLFKPSDPPQEPPERR